MGNLEKAGVLVVVVLLAIILGVAFHNNGEPNDKSLSALYKQEGSGASRVGEADPSGTEQDPPANGGVRTTPGQTPSDPPTRIEPTDKNEGRDAGEKPPVEQKPKVVDPAPLVDPTPVNPRPVSPPVVNEWPKKVKVEKSDGSLLAVVRRVYGTKDAQSMLPAVIKENPGLKPTALKIGQELNMPAKTSPDSPKDQLTKKPAATPPVKKASDADAKSAVAKDSKSGTKKAATKSTTSKTAAVKPAAEKSSAVKATVKSGEKKRLSFMPKR